MKDSQQIMTRYLLGELSESERLALEEKYFSNVEIFDEITRVESELVDNYVRGKLSPPVRERFEQFYLAHPERRERVKFAEALASRLDQIEDPGEVPAEPVGFVSWWQKLAGRSLTPAFSVALVALLLVIGGIWLFIEGRRVRHELAQTQASLASQEQRERELQQQIADERLRAEQLTAELEHLREQLASQTTSPEPSVPAFVSFLISVGSTRGTDRPGTLVIPTGTAEVRLQVRLNELDYPAYTAVLQAIGGAEIFNRQKIKPRVSKSGATLTLSVPAASLRTGDYLLTLKTASGQGESEDLSKSIFHVEKR